MSTHGGISVFRVGCEQHTGSKKTLRRRPIPRERLRCAIGEVLESRVHLSGVSYVASPPAPTSAGPWCVRTADLNGDDNPDMVVVDRDASQVQVFMGQSDGTFQSPAIRFSILSYDPISGLYHADAPRVVEIADFNGDGKLDLLVPTFAGREVQVFSRDDSGTFTQTASISAGPTGPAALNGPMALVTGHFDQNDSMDVAVANYNADTVTVILTGHESESKAYPVGANPGSMAAGDFNGDGIRDLATGNFSSGTISILYGKGDGTFSPQQQYHAAFRTEDIVAGDFNGDKKDDLAVAGGDRRVRVLLSNGAARTFKKPVGYLTGPGSLGLAAGDLNADGKLDLAVTNYYGSSVSVLVGNSDGTFNRRANFRTSIRRPRSVAMADFNHDGLADMVAVDETLAQYSILWRNTAPTAIELSRTAVPPTPARQVVATLTAEDAPPDDHPKFALVKGTGSQDNSWFSVRQSGAVWELKARKNLTLAKGVYHIRLRVTDAGGLSFDQEFEISITEPV